ncbi:chalcone isomerase family protein [Vibrio makurazakiensis]|uniref:chalcone isomerase family protein n=1 Tax=Vibrio makurazakiensis TaxID=2910250 RepID=UPI003D1067D7
MNYLFWTIYKADYYTEGARNSAKSNQVTAENRSGTTNVEEPTEVSPVLYNRAAPQQQKALRIEYFKSIDRDALVQATIEQWEHLGYEQSEIDRWAEPLVGIWPNVEPGSTLTLLIGEYGQSQFYFNNELIGTINTDTFGPAFLSIWLSENTSEPVLRKQLLGLNR